MLRLLDAAKARAGSQSSFARCSRAAMVAPSAPRPWTGSLRLHAERTILAKLACTLERARAVPLAAQAVRSRTQWQSSGEPSSGGWPTPRGSCATTEIGVRSDARPASLSAVLENECANPTHDRVAELRQSFRQIPPSLAIALGLLVVRLRHVRVALGRSDRASSAWSGCHRSRGAQASSGINYRREPPRSAVASQLAAQLCCRHASSSSGHPALYLGRAEGTGLDPRAFISRDDATGPVG